MTRKVLSLLVLCGFIFFAENGLAITVNFGNYNSGPNDTLVIEGVTITGNQITAVQGVGLGSGSVGAPGYLDRISQYGAGPDGSYSSQREGLSLQVNGVLNSFTIKPYFKDNIQLPIEFVYIGGGDTLTGIRGEVWQTVYATGSSYTFDMPYDPVDGTFISLASYWDERMFFWGYLAERGYPETTFEYGFTIASCDYTPNQVPEAGTLFLLCSGLIGAVGFKRRYAKK